jgi:hypothetical protein
MHMPVFVLSLRVFLLPSDVPVIAQIKRKLVRRAYKPKTTIVKTKWEKCGLSIYQSTIMDGVVYFLPSILSAMHMPVFALSLRVFLLPSVVILEGSLFPLVRMLGKKYHDSVIL